MTCNAPTRDAHGFTIHCAKRPHAGEHAAQFVGGIPAVTWKD